MKLTGGAGGRCRSDGWWDGCDGCCGGAAGDEVTAVAASGDVSPSPDGGTGGERPTGGVGGATRGASL
jgi:hypothetical protein